MGEVKSRPYQRDPDVVCRRVATEIFLVPIRRNVREVGLFTLNEVAGVVWDHLDGNHTLEDLVRVVVDEFEVDPATARRDIENFLGKLFRIGGVRET